MEDKFTLRVRCDSDASDTVNAMMLRFGNELKAALDFIRDPLNEVILYSDGDAEYFTDER